MPTADEMIKELNGWQGVQDPGQDGLVAPEQAPQLSTFDLYQKFRNGLISDDEASVLKQKQQDNLAKTYDDPGFFNMAGESARRQFNDLYMGTKEIINEFDAETGRPEEIDALNKFREEQLVENYHDYMTDPSAIPGWKSTAADVVGRGFAIAAPLYLASKVGAAMGPALSLSVAGAQTAKAAVGPATKAIGRLAANKYGKAMLADIGLGTALGAADQHKTALEGGAEAALENFFLRGVLGAGFTRTPESPEIDTRAKIDLIKKLKEKVAPGIQLLQAHTTDNIDEKGFFSAATRAPGSRNYMKELHDKTRGALAKWVKDTIAPEFGEDAVEGMHPAFNNGWLEKLRLRGDASRNVLPKAVDVSNKVFKHEMETVIRENWTKGARRELLEEVKTGQISGETWQTMINAIEKRLNNPAITGTPQQTTYQNLKNSLLKIAEASDPNYAAAQKSANRDFALHRVIKDGRNPTTGMMDLRRMRKVLKEFNRGKNGPFSYDLDGESRSLTHDLYDVLSIVDPENRDVFSPATLHDNQSTVEMLKNTITHPLDTLSLYSPTSYENPFLRSLSELPISYRLSDTGVGFSPDQINAFYDVMLPAYRHSILTDRDESLIEKRNKLRSEYVTK